MSVQASDRLWTLFHEQVCLCLIAAGQPKASSSWRTRGKNLHSRSGGLMLMDPGEAHVTLKVTAPADFDVVRFSSEVLEQARSELSLRSEFHFRAPACENPVVASAISRLVRAHARGAEAFELEALSAELLAATLGELGEKPSSSGIVLNPIRDFRLRRVRDYLLSHLERKPTLDQLAQELKMSKFRLCTTFKSAYGVSVGQYWTAARVARGAHLLTLGHPIKVVAAELGFVDEAFFTRVFRRHRGLPPGAWSGLHQANSRPKLEPRPLVRGEVVRNAGQRGARRHQAGSSQAADPIEALASS